MRGWLRQQKVKFRVKLTEMYRASLGFTQTHRKVEGEEGLGDTLLIWHEISLEQRRSSLSGTRIGIP